MFTSNETKRLLRNTKLHWIVKANAVRNYINENSFEKAVYDLGLNKRSIEDLWKLSKYAQFFPLLKEIPEKKVCLDLIKVHMGNSVEMREAIAVMAARFKSKLLQPRITHLTKRRKISDEL